MDSSMVDESKILDLVVTEPIEDMCYMIPYAWWTGWAKYIKTGKATLSPEVIPNYELVEMRDQYDQLFPIIVMNALNGLDVFVDWNQMELKHRLKEGVDYVLVSYKVWRTLSSAYGGTPTISFAVVPKAPPSKNCLSTAYKNGYPDLSPIQLNIHNLLSKSREKHYFGYPITFDMTSAQLYLMVGQLLKLGPKEFALRFKSDGKAHSGDDPTQGDALHNSLETLAQINFTPFTEIIVVPPIKEVSADEKLKFVDMPVFTAELFENLDPDQPSERRSQWKEETKAEDTNVGLDTDFAKAEEAGKREKRSFESPPLEDVIKCLDGLGKELADLINVQKK